MPSNSILEQHWCRDRRQKLTLFLPTTWSSPSVCGHVSSVADEEYLVMCHTYISATCTQTRVVTQGHVVCGGVLTSGQESLRMFAWPWVGRVGWYVWYLRWKHGQGLGTDHVEWKYFRINSQWFLRLMLVDTVVKCRRKIWSTNCDGWRKIWTISYILHELLADWSDVLAQGGAEHHHLLLVGGGAEDFLDISSHV